jgi:hypothetical protein
VIERVPDVAIWQHRFSQGLLFPPTLHYILPKTHLKSPNIDPVMLRSPESWECRSLYETSVMWSSLKHYSISPLPYISNWIFENGFRIKVIDIYSVIGKWVTHIPRPSSGSQSKNIFHGTPHCTTLVFCTISRLLWLIVASSSDHSNCKHQIFLISQYSFYEGLSYISIAYYRTLYRFIHAKSRQKFHALNGGTNCEWMTSVRNIRHTLCCTFRIIDNGDHIQYKM